MSVSRGGLPNVAKADTNADAKVVPTSSANEPPPPRYFITDEDVVCPITQEIFYRPVMLLPSGVTVEEEKAEDLIERNTSYPQGIKITGFILNKAVANIVANYLRANPGERKNQYKPKKNNALADAKNDNAAAVPPGAVARVTQEFKDMNLTIEVNENSDVDPAPPSDDEAQDNPSTSPNDLAIAVDIAPQSILGIVRARQQGFFQVPRPVPAVAPPGNIKLPVAIAIRRENQVPAEH